MKSDVYTDRCLLFDVFVLAVSCNRGQHALVSFLKGREDLLVIPLVDIGEPLHVQVGLHLKKIIELVKQ